MLDTALSKPANSPPEEAMHTSDPELRRQLDAFNKIFNEAFDKNDAAAMVPLFTEDAVIVSNGGIIKGLAAIERYYADKFANEHDSDHVAVTDPGSPYALDDSTMWATGSWTLTVQPKGENPIPLNGYWSAIYSREGSILKEKMQTWNIAPAIT
jgi:ketosteroid isomerase-like protein